MAGQKGRVPAKNRLTGYPFNRRDNEKQSEAQFPKDPRFSDANTFTNERTPTMDLTTRGDGGEGGKIGNSKKTGSTMNEARDGALGENAHNQWVRGNLAD